MAEEQWEVLDSKSLVEHPFLTVTMTRVRLPEGRIIPDWPIVKTPDFINVLVLNENSGALVIESYKHGLGRSSWQVLGGYIESGEVPLEAAKRELLEETGYIGERWQHLGSFVVDANRHVDTGHFFIARGARKITAPKGGDLEQQLVRWVPLEELKRAVLDGRVALMSHATAIGLALPVLGI